MSLTPFEKDEARKCDALVLQCGGEIVSFSQPRRTMQTFGIPDRRYRVHGVAFWWEVKSTDQDAKLTEEQYDFLLAEIHAMCPAACGTLADLTWYLPEVRRGKPFEAGKTLLKKWLLRGFRRTRKRRTG